MTCSEQTPNTTSEAYFRIGQVASAWSTLEMLVDQAIWSIMMVDSQVGACLTAQVQSLQYKMNALISMCDLYGQNALVKKLKKFMEDAQPCMKARNKIVHSPVFTENSSNMAYRRTLTAHRKLELTVSQPNKDSELKIASDTLELINRFTVLSDEIQQAKKNWRIRP